MWSVCVCGVCVCVCVCVVCGVCVCVVCVVCVCVCVCVCVGVWVVGGWVGVFMQRLLTLLVVVLMLKYISSLMHIKRCIPTTVT